MVRVTPRNWRDSAVRSAAATCCRSASSIDDSRQWTGPDAGLRAGLAVATLLGLGVMHGSELRASTVVTLVDRYAPTAQAYLTP
ncbi:TetR/AcrR family transcriptional regulator [Streptomyces collinus]|uniref:TetR/AcrR family transcriptional regulator n=1 Tax=Streptomyces collinus TaxID=42684 RepID=UPI0038199188